ASMLGPAYGGGIYNAGTLTLSGCTVSNNFSNPDMAPAYGGGIYNVGTLAVSNCTVSGNYTNGIGGGIFNAGTLAISTSNFSSTFAFAPYPGRYTSNIYGPYTAGGGNTSS